MIICWPGPGLWSPRPASHSARLRLARTLRPPNPPAGGPVLRLLLVLVPGRRPRGIARGHGHAGYKKDSLKT
eukprot:2309359-Rhodomonas_salina.2